MEVGGGGGGEGCGERDRGKGEDRFVESAYISTWPVVLPQT